MIDERLSTLVVLIRPSTCTNEQVPLTVRHTGSPLFLYDHEGEGKKEMESLRDAKRVMTSNAVSMQNIVSSSDLGDCLLLSVRVGAPFFVVVRDHHPNRVCQNHSKRRLLTGCSCSTKQEVSVQTMP